MVRTCTLELDRGDGEKPSVVKAEFTDEEWSILEQASQCARQLDVPGIFASTGGTSFGINIKWDVEEGWSCSGSILEWDGAPAALHKMRPFVLQSERTEFGRVCNILTRRIEDDRFREVITGLRALYDGKEMQALLHVRVDGIVVNSRKTLEMYLNAYEYHRDEEKQAAMARLTQVLPDTAVRGFMLLLVADRLKAIRGLQVMLEVVAGREREATMRFPKLGGGKAEAREDMEE
jgi:hypothetical protein